MTSNNDTPRQAPHRLAGHRRMRVLYASIVLAMIAGAGGAATFFSHRHAAAASPIAPAPALTVTVASPRHAVWPLTVEASGAIAAWQEASIGTQIGGYEIMDVRVNVGDQVRKGEILARLNPALLLADEAQLRASDDQAEANRKRILGLKSSGAVSDQDVLQYVTQAKTADALLASKRLQLVYTDVIAPDDGAISSRTATLGAVAPVGQELFRLIRQNRLEWRGELTAAQMARVQPGQRIALDLPDGTVATAKVRQLAPSLNDQSRLGIVYADIAPGSAARAGMYANGRIALGQSPATVIPAESVVIRDGRNYVLKLASEGASLKVSLIPVGIGRRQGDELEIVSGVSDGDRLVDQGAGFLTDGDTVRLATQNTSTSEAAP